MLRLAGEHALQRACPDCLRLGKAACIDLGNRRDLDVAPQAGRLDQQVGLPKDADQGVRSLMSGRFVICQVLVDHDLREMRCDHLRRLGVVQRLAADEIVYGTRELVGGNRLLDTQRGARRLRAPLLDQKCNKAHSDIQSFNSRRYSTTKPAKLHIRASGHQPNTACHHQIARELGHPDHNDEKPQRRAEDAGYGGQGIPDDRRP